MVAHRSVWLLGLALVFLVASFPGCTEGKPKPQKVKLVGNSTCPVSGNPVGGAANAPSFHSDYKGYRIGFMCPTCKGEFDGASAEKKLRLLNKALKSVGKPPVK